MSVEVKVPQLGESVVEGTVGRWLKAEGDAVAVGEPLVELETDKVNVEVPSTAGGTLESIVKQEGETVAVGEVVGLISDSGAAAESRAPATSVAEASGTFAQGSGATATGNQSQAPSPPAQLNGDGDSARATPLAKRVAAEHGLDLSMIPGTGPSGRVRKDDVDTYLERQSQEATRASGVLETERVDGKADTGQNEPAGASDQRPEERIRMSRRRQTIAQRLVEAQQTAAMLTTFNEVNMAAIMEIRKRRKEAFKEQHGVNLGFMSFFTRAVIGALKAYPRLNAEIQGTEMILKHYYDIGIAVGVDEGLVVPVIRDADRLTFAEIEQQVVSLANKAKSNSLSLAELQGGTFTITNGGTFGSLLSTPILNAPQVGILGMHKIQERPVALNGQVVIEPMMYVALSYDHRIVDGSEAVRFLVRVKELLEDPETLLLEG